MVVKKKRFIVTFRKRGKTGRFKGSKVFSTRIAAQNAIRRSKKLLRAIDADLPRSQRNKLFFNHKVLRIK